MNANGYNPLATLDPSEHAALSAEQVGSLLGVSADSVRGLHRTQELRGFCIGRSLRFHPTRVREYLRTKDQEANNRSGQGLS